MRTINIYREYIHRGIDLSRRTLKDFIGPNFWPLIFTTDFNDYDAANNGLTYRFYDPEQSLNLTKFVANFLANFKAINYTTYANYRELLFCGFKSEWVTGAGAGTCVGKY